MYIRSHIMSIPQHVSSMFLYIKEKEVFWKKAKTEHKTSVWFLVNILMA